MGHRNRYSLQSEVIGRHPFEIKPVSSRYIPTHQTVMASEQLLAYSNAISGTQLGYSGHRRSALRSP
jgi:hypothetical protein